MSTYLYGCSLCGHRHEERHSMKESPLIVCPECSNPMDKVINAEYTGATFKWWSEDYADIRYRPRN